MNGPLDGGGLDSLVSGMVEAVDDGGLGRSLDDVQGVLVLVVADDGVEEGGARELEDGKGAWLRGLVARTGGAHVTVRSKSCENKTGQDVQRRGEPGASDRTRT